MSLQKDRLSWAFIGLLLLAVGSAAYFVLWPQLQPHVTLRLGDGIFNARIVTVKEHVQNGLPDTDQLPENKAVLHVYDRDGRWLMDMRQRRELFDVIWLSSEKKVVHIVKNASSDSMPSAVFSSDKDARYVIELRGGTVDARAIRINTAAYFDERNIEGLKL